MLASTAESIPLSDRVYWLATEHWSDPGVAVLGDIDDHPIDYCDEKVWDGHLGVIRSVLARRAMREGDLDSAAVDAVFTSEEYGGELAGRLGATHVAVDPHRLAYPVSGVEVRAETTGHWHQLAASTRAGLCARVVVLGSESTGTTTLAEQLAAHYRIRSGALADTRRVVEQRPLHTEEKLAAEQALARVAGSPSPQPASLVWTVGDFVDVARRQAMAEDDAAARGGPLLVCDNDSWAATIWCEHHFGRSYPEVEQAVGDRRPALYLLTDHAGVRFERDGRGEGDPRREWMTARFVRGLRERGVPWVLLSGSRTHRLLRAVRACDALLRSHFRFADPLGG
ncbi:MAG: AAA family ATPase [Labedaea sp.]